MSIVVDCTACGQSLAIPEDYVGKEVRCPKCKHVFVAAAANRVPPRVEAAAEPAAPGPERTGITSETPRREREPEREYIEERPRGRRGDWDVRYEPPYLAGQAIGKALRWCFIGLMCTQLVGVGVFTSAYFHPEWHQPVGNAQGTALAFTLISGAYNCFEGMLLLATIILFLIWTFQSFNNLYTMEVEGLAFSPGWAVVFYFIPFANLVVPYLVMQQTWRASHPDAGPLRRDWATRPGSWDARVWWAAWIVGGLAPSIIITSQIPNWFEMFVAQIANPNNPQIRPEFFQAFDLANISSKVAYTIGAIFVFRLIGAIMSRQEEKFAKLFPESADRD